VESNYTNDLLNPEIKVCKSINNQIEFTSFLQIQKNNIQDIASHNLVKEQKQEQEQKQKQEQESGKGKVINLNNPNLKIGIK